MACMTQERKKTLAKALEALNLKKQGFRYTLSVRNHSTIVMNLTSGPVDFMKSYVQAMNQIFSERGQVARGGVDQYPIDVNVYHYKDHFSGLSREVLSQILKALNTGNHDHSDIMSDYFDVGWYVDVTIGTYQKPYQVAPAMLAFPPGIPR